MELTSEEIKIQNEAIEHIKKNKEKLIKDFIISKNPLRVGFITIFMAGSPGAGKTEFSQRYIPIAIDKNDQKFTEWLQKINIDIKSVDCALIRIDVDEIRGFFPQYKKTDNQTGARGNAHVVQKAANKGLDILRDYCLANQISFLHDGTFGNYETMKKIINKSLRADRDVQIFYLYQDPLQAWEFTKAREHVEGRNIIKEKFIEQYFNSKDNVIKIKQEFGSKVKIHCVLKNNQNKDEKIEFNVHDIDQFFVTQYNKGTIQKYTIEDLKALIS